MSSKKQLTGMRGVYLVAAEMAGRGFIGLADFSKRTWC
jgi:hypothetical protein